MASLLKSSRATRPAVTGSCPIGEVQQPSHQVKAGSKTYIKLSARQFEELKWLLTDSYGIAKPSWLVSNFKTNQRRTAFLNHQLEDAGLDDSWCSYAQPDNNWANELHCIWHKLNLGRG